MGLGNRGDQVLSAFLEQKDCEVAAVCDIYQPYAEFAAKKIGGNDVRHARTAFTTYFLDATKAEPSDDGWHHGFRVVTCYAKTTA